MAWLTWIFLESLPALAAVLGTVLFVLLVIWRRGSSPRPLLVGLAVAAVLLIVQQVVVTQREQADRIMTPVELDILEGKIAALRDAVAPDFTSGHFDRDEFLDYAAGRLDAVNVRWLDRRQFVVVDSGSDRFTLEVAYLATISGDYGGTFPSRWRIDFAKTPAGWRITHIRCLKLAWLDTPSWEDLTRY